jgi:hypothetical protein
LLYSCCIGIVQESNPRLRKPRLRGFGFVFEKSILHNIVHNCIDMGSQLCTNQFPFFPSLPSLGPGLPSLLLKQRSCNGKETMLSLPLHSSLSSFSAKSFVLQSSPSFFRNPRAPSRDLRTFLTASASSGSTISDESHEALAGRRGNYGGVRLEETVCISSGKLRLDSWISSRISGISRARVQSSIRSGLVAVNGRVVDKVISISSLY